MSFKSVRERFNEKLAAMTPDERHFMADDALIAAIDDALADLVEAAKPAVIKSSDKVKPGIGMVPSFSVAPGKMSVVSDDDGSP